MQTSVRSASLQHATIHALRIGVPVLALMCIVLAGLHQIRFPSRVANGLTMTAVAACMLLIACWLLLFRISNRTWVANGLAFFVLLVILIETLAVIGLSGDLRFNANVPLLLMVSGFILLPIPFLLSFHLVTLIGWIWTVSRWDPSLATTTYLAVPVGVSLLVAYLGRNIRVRDILQGEEARLREMDRRRELEESHKILSLEVKTRREREAELNFSHKILSKVRNLILVADEIGDIVWASPSIEFRLGFGLDTALGDGWYRLTRKDPQEACKEKESVARSLADKPSRDAYQRQIYDADGDSRWIVWQDSRLDESHLIGVGTDITLLKQVEEQRDNLIADLQQALSEVKTLTGLLPICSNCKQVRNDSGYWESVEHFVEQRSGATFSHGICPDCLKALYPDLDQ